MVLPDQHFPTNPFLLPCLSLPLLILALHQHPCCTGRCRQCPACQWCQLHVVDLGQFHLPVVHEALPLPLVGMIQLSSLDGSRCWRHHRPHHHILRPAIAKGHCRVFNEADDISNAEWVDKLRLSQQSETHPCTTGCSPRICCALLLWAVSLVLHTAREECCLARGASNLQYRASLGIPT